MIYFTSDLHLGHANVIRFQDRPFADVDEMNEALIANYNEVVGPDDTVYILGDVSNRCPGKQANEMIARLNGHKILIMGNHDMVHGWAGIKYDESLFEHVGYFEQINFDYREWSGRRFR